MFFNKDSVLKALIKKLNYEADLAIEELNESELNCVEAIQTIFDEFLQGTVEIENDEEFYIQLDNEEELKENQVRQRGSAEFRRRQEFENSKSEEKDVDYIPEKFNKPYESVYKHYTRNQIQFVKKGIESGQTESSMAKKLKLSVDNIKVIKRSITSGKGNLKLAFTT